MDASPSNISSNKHLDNAFFEVFQGLDNAYLAPLPPDKIANINIRFKRRRSYKSTCFHHGDLQKYRYVGRHSLH